MNTRQMYAAVSAIYLSISIIAAAQPKQNITVEDLYLYYTFYPERPDEITPMSDGLRYAYISEGTAIQAVDFATGKNVETLLDLSKIEDCPIESIDGFSLSADDNMILLYTNASGIYRYSFTADYYVYNIHYNELKALSEEGEEQAAVMSPNGLLVAYVRDNNVYVKKLRYDTTSAVTDDGEWNKIRNGIPDWVNEEEFALESMLAWSPDSKELAFCRYDESEVEMFAFPMYSASYPYYADYELYPGFYTYKYPKAGEKNSTVSVKVYNVENRTTKTMQVSDEKEFYISRILWTGNEKELAIVKLNRRQDRMDLLLANTASTVCRNVLTERNKRYVEESAYQNLMFTPDGQQFVMLSERDGYEHIYLYASNGVMKAQLTKGQWDVTEIVGYDPTLKTVYYQAAVQTPLERDLYSVTLDGKTTMRLTQGGGTYSAQMGRQGKYFVREFSSATTPPVYTICDAKGKVVRTIEDNKTVENELVKYNFFNKEFFTFTNPDSITLHGWMIRPADFDAKKQYPLLLVQYSGPKSQSVSNEWELGWEQCLAAEGYIVACVDPRGTAARGEEFRKCTYQKLGALESDDLVAAADYFASLGYVDSSRIGIWGWSYGGFMSSLCLCRFKAFKVGIAVAPVTSWRFYDTVYTERYMRRPDENIRGYDENSPLELAGNLSGRLFLIHGTADDNVHQQNQLEFVDRLVQCGKQFDMFVYPNRNHGIYGGWTRAHLYNMMINYLKTNL